MPQVLIAVAIKVAISVAISLVVSLLFPPQRRQAQPQALQPTPPAIPRPSDGKFNFKQNVPHLPIVLGRVKKGSDYMLLEEANGTAFHVMVWAGHIIGGFVQHWLHDEPVSISESVSGTGITGPVVSPAHFESRVRITTRHGQAPQSHFGAVSATFPTIWTSDHRGDGLAVVLMECDTVAQDRYTDVYPQQMPVHTAIGNGAPVYDPRDEEQDPDDPSTWAFSRNLALLRLHQITQPWGFKRSLADCYLPDWVNAADVCDETVVNRDEDEEPRYHGGLWFRANADPVEVGRKLDEAGELVVYERGDGLIGVHAGEYVAPDIEITENDIFEFVYDANRSAASTVLAVRGRFTDPNNGYNTVDAAIRGDPYPGDDGTQRTATVDNEAVQSHNHIQRLQKLREIRANAPRVSLVVDWVTKGEAARRRFVKLTYPRRGLDQAILEIVGRPKFSLRNLTLALEGIVVPATLYDFDAATEEGVPGGEAGEVSASGVPVPTGFAVAWLSDGAGYYGRGTWTFVSDALTYEMEYQLADASEAARKVASESGQTVLRTPPLPDVAHRFRLRAVSNDRRSAWTAWVAPGDSGTGGSEGDTSSPGDPTFGTINYNGLTDKIDGNWTNPAGSNLHHTEVYRAFESTTFTDSVLIHTDYGAPSAVRTFSDPEAMGGGAVHVSASYWLRSFNGSGAPSNLVGPETFSF